MVELVQFLGFFSNCRRTETILKLDDTKEISRSIKDVIDTIANSFLRLKISVEVGDCEYDRAG